MSKPGSRKAQQESKVSKANEKLQRVDELKKKKEKVFRNTHFTCVLCKDVASRFDVPDGYICIKCLYGKS